MRRRSPRIMFNSATDKHPKGLSNRNELVGKYLMCHSAANVWALFDEDVQNYMGTAANQFMSYETYDKRWPKKGFGSIFLRTGAAHEAERRPRVSAARSVRTAARRLHEAGRARAHPHRPVRRSHAAARKTASSFPATRTSSGCRSRASSMATIRTRSTAGPTGMTSPSKSPRPPSRRRPGKGAQRPVRRI